MEEERTEQSDDLSGAFFRVGLLVDQTWWSDRDYGDGYKLASLGLWNEVIHSNERLSNLGSSPEKPAISEQPKKRSPRNSAKKPDKSTVGNHTLLRKDKLLMPTCRMEVAQVQKALASMDPTVPAPLPQSAYTDTKCVLGSRWPLTLLQTYPALNNTLKDPSSRSVFSQKHALRGIQKDENTLPYSIETMEELMIHQRITSPSVKNVWATDSETITFNKSKELQGGVWGPGLNANVPEFYPSVLLPPRQCPPRYSNIFGANYQAEVFPYNEDKTSENKEAEVVSRKKKSRRGTSEQRLSLQSQGVSSSSSPNLLRSRPVAENVQSRAKQNETKADVTFWLQNVYPHRLLELSKLGGVVRHLGRLCQQIALPFPPQVIQSAQQAAPPPIIPSSERRLYRDVLARKIEDAANKNKEEADQSPYDELERQALEQYQSSETCLVAQNSDITSDPVDSKFQDLEREALEQYTEDCDEQLDGSSTAKVSPTTQKPSAKDFKVNFRKDVIVMNRVAYTQAKRENALEILAPESVANSVLADTSQASLPTEKDIGFPTEIGGLIFSPCKSKQSRKQARKKKKRQLEEEQKFVSSKQHQEKLRSGSCASFQVLNVANSEEEIRRLATNLKYKVLNYLKGVDLRITEDNRKANPKNKDFIENPIQRRIRVSDITDLDTYKTYIREVSAKARVTLLLHFKRIRSEIMESSSRGMVSFVSPTTCEKRNVKKIIKKCLELKNHAETMNEVPRNLLNCVKREVTDTLELVHHTMEVIYTLRNMSKQASEDVAYLKNGRGLVTELYMEETTLEDKSGYIKQRVLTEERSVLLVVLFPRKSGLLFDRDYVRLNTSNGWSIYMNHDDLRATKLPVPQQANYDLRFVRELSLRGMLHPAGETTANVGRTGVRVNNSYWFQSSKMETKDIWSPRNWTHVLQAGEASSPTWVTFSSTCRQAEHFAVEMVHLIQSQERKRQRAKPNLRARSRRDPPEDSRTSRWERVPSRKRQSRR